MAGLAVLSDFLRASLLSRPKILFPCANFQRPTTPEKIDVYLRKSAAIFFCFSPRLLSA
jgi:hypothetical protein